MQVERSVAEIMEADHVELDVLLADLNAEIYRDQPDVVSLYQRLDLFWARLAMHIRAEHLVVFPVVTEAASCNDHDREQVPTMLGELRRDHDFFVKELARAIKALRLVADFGNDAETLVIVRRLVEGVVDRLGPHNKIEEQVIYPLAGHARVADVVRELENLPQRFRASQPGS